MPWTVRYGGAGADGITYPHDDHFWSFVAKAGHDECWIWIGGRDRGGYGIYRRKDSQRQVRSHRFSFELAGGSIPPGYYVCHSCDNPPCVNPAHLWAGTPRDNRIDAVRKGRAVAPRLRGAEHPEGVRTHCDNGHIFDEENTRIHAAGHRVCRTCDRDRARAYRQRRLLNA